MSQGEGERGGFIVLRGGCVRVWEPRPFGFTPQKIGPKSVGREEMEGGRGVRGRRREEEPL